MLFALKVLALSLGESDGETAELSGRLGLFSELRGGCAQKICHNRLQVQTKVLSRGFATGTPIETTLPYSCRP